MEQSLYEEMKRKTYEKAAVRGLTHFEEEQEQQEIKVSIVIPVCNVEQYLRECLDSAVGQTLQEIEIICVNDGSTDDSLKILMEYAKKDNRVKIIDKENAGYGHTMNIGMDMARGEYIGIIESDDYVVPEMYEELYETAARENLDIIKSDFCRFYGEGENAYKEYNKTARRDENYNVLIKPAEYQECFKFIMNTWSGIYRAEFLRMNAIRHNETPGASFQDNGFWFWTNMLAERTWYLNKAFYMNRRDNPNSSVYDTKKVYCVNEEYHLIDQNMIRLGVKEKFLAAYCYKKFHSYLFTLNRIAPCFRKEYLNVFAKEFRGMEQDGGLSTEFFSNTDTDQLRWIMRNEEEYYYIAVCRKIKVSVILPVHNVEPYLRQCMDSLLSQTLREIEVICINDGSTDGSPAILTEYQARDHRIKIINQENKGAGAARNVGIEAAEGQYLSFLDADDFFDKDMLRLAYQRAEEKQADICIYEADFYDNNTGKVEKCGFAVRKDKLPKGDVFSRTQINTNIFHDIMGWAWDKLYRRSFVLNQKLRFQEQRTSNDMYFVFASLLKAGRITILNRTLYHQRRNVKGSLSNTREKSFECFYSALMKIRDELEKMQIYPQYEQDFVNYALHSCLWNLNSLKEPAAESLFKLLRKEWFENLGIVEREEGFYTNASEYEQYREIVSIPMESEMAYYMYQLNFWKKRYEYEISHSVMSIPIKIREGEVLTVAQMKEKLAWNRKEKSRLESKLRQGEKAVSEAESIRKELERVRQEWARAEYALSETRKSKSYRLAMALSWIPRRLRRKQP